MKRLITIVGIAFTLLGCGGNNQVTSQSDLLQICQQDTIMNAKSLPSSIDIYRTFAGSWERVKEFNYDDRGNLIQEINYQHEYTVTQTFDANSNLLTKFIDYENETLSHSNTANTALRSIDQTAVVFIIDQFYTYTYNEKGELLSESLDTGNDGIMNETKTYTYDENGYLLRKESYYTPSPKPYQTYVYTYDESGKTLSEEFSANPYKELDYNMTYSYDDQSNVIQKYQTYTSGVIDNKIYRYTYNSSSQVLSEEVYEVQESGEALYSSTLNTYDERGNLLNLKESFGDSTDYRIYEYTYDDNNNLLTYTSLDAYGTNSYQQNLYDAYNNLLVKAYASDKESQFYNVYCYRYEE